MIKIITVGAIKEKYLKDAIEEYTKRISKYTNIEIKIKKYISPRDYVITLEIEGKQLTSEEFAQKINSIYLESSNITFIIGGSYGISQEIKNMSNFKLSFSKMTFPHQLFRVNLLEQIYRAYKINNNESYHK